jgi:hypothetical protein
MLPRKPIETNKLIRLYNSLPHWSVIIIVLCIYLFIIRIAIFIILCLIWLFTGKLIYPLV